ncbi:MAG: translation initiation factor IF-2 [Minisyncoccia bacterium]
MEHNGKQKENLIFRPPIVVVLGHVDHGKTSLLDYIRKTKVAEKEAGGITQHIGAYEIEYKNKKITFIDTPGHEAFKKIRSRGAKAADIALLVVAADEGVKPQTIESLKHIKEAKIPFIVVLTKIDKENVEPDRVKKELLEQGVFLEGWGGDVSWVEVSSKTGKGIDELLDLIILMAEMENLKGNPLNYGQGVIIESFLDSKRGPTATVILTDGTLKLKDEIYAGGVCGKAKIIENFLGEAIKEATFSSPVRIIGFENPPPVGAIFISGREGENLKETATERKKERNRILGDINSSVCIPLIIKTDVISSGEALEETINKIGLKRNWAFNLIINETGDISEGDLKLANIKGTLIIGFKTKRKPEIANFLINNPNLIIIEGEIIYDLEKKIEEVIENRFIQKPTEEIIGKLEVLKIFNPIKGNQLIGGKVIEGKVINKNRFYLIRNEKKIGEGRLINLQKNKIDVNEVETNEEGGLLVDCKEEIEEGDILEFIKKI